MEFYNDKFKKIRDIKGITNREIAEKLNISEQAVQKWNSGASKPRTLKIFDLANILGCSVADISDVSPLDIKNPELATEKLFPDVQSPETIDEQLILAFLRNPKNKQRREKLLHEAKMSAVELWLMHEKEETP